MQHKIKIKYLRLIVEVKQHYITVFILNFFKNLYENARTTNSHLRFQIFQFLPFFIASSLTGIAAFIYSRMFSFTEKMSISLIDKYNWIVFILTPISFIFSWWIVRKYSGAAKGSGIPQVMAAMELANPTTRHLVQKLLSFKIIIVKIISSIAKVFGGGVLGREGPTIQISSSIFVIIYKILPSWWPHVSKKNILVAGAASGLAAAFNTPLGGIIFAIEELSKSNIKYYKSPLFISVIIAGLSAQGLSGSYLYLGYPQLATSGFMVYLGVFIVALITGYIAAKSCVILLKTIMYVNKDTNISRQFIIVFISAMIVALSIFFLGTDAMGSGKELMERMLFTNNKSVEWYIPIVRIVNLITSFSFGGAGGIFAPALSSGATIGSFISDMLHLGGNNANLLIVVGMTAFLTGVTRAPFTSAIIVFEMTDRHSVIFFLMMGAILANLISNTVDSHSLYDHLKESYLQNALKNKKDKSQ